GVPRVAGPGEAGVVLVPRQAVALARVDLTEPAVLPDLDAPPRRRADGRGLARPGQEAGVRDHVVPELTGGEEPVAQRLGLGAPPGRQALAPVVARHDPPLLGQRLAGG